MKNFTCNTSKSPWELFHKLLESALNNEMNIWSEFCMHYFDEIFTVMFIVFFVSKIWGSYYLFFVE